MAREIRNSEGTRLVDTVQFSLQVAENIWQANLGSEIGISGNIQFVPGATVISAQIEGVMQENSVLRGVDPQDLPLSIYLGDRVPAGIKPGTRSILVDGEFFKPLLLINPEKEPDKREEFSDYCVMLFDTVSIAVLDAYVPEVELTRRQEVAEALFELHMNSLINFQKSHEQTPSITGFIDAHREKFSPKEDGVERAVVAKGLKVSITEGDEKIITMNSVQEDDVRILMMNDLRKQFMQSMKRRHFWFKPGKDIASDIEYPNNEDGMRVLELIQSAGCEGNMKNVIKLYMSGELSALFANLRIPPIYEEVQEEADSEENVEMIPVSSSDNELSLGTEVVIQDSKRAEQRKPRIIKSAVSPIPPRPDVQVVFGNSRDLSGRNDIKKQKRRRYYPENEDDDEPFE